MNHLTIKTQAAIQQLEESLIQLSNDDFDDLVEELKRLMKMAENIKEVSQEINY
jgi:hypothetical protein